MCGDSRGIRGRGNVGPEDIRPTLARGQLSIDYYTRTPRRDCPSKVFAACRPLVRL